MINILQIALVLILARTFGYFFKKFGYPQYIGYILSGIFISNYIISVQFIDTSINVLYEIGLLFLMFLIAMNTHTYIIKGSVERYTVVELMTASVIFMITYIVGDVVGFNFILRIILGFFFLQSSLVIPYLSLTRIRRIETKEGKTIMGMQIIDDISGLISASIITIFLLSSTSIEFVIKIFGVLLVFFLFLNKRILEIFEKGIKRIHVGGFDEGTGFIVILLIFTLSAISILVDIPAFIGAFIVGMIFSRLSYSDVVKDKLLFVGNDIFLPFFFSFIGMNVNILTVPINFLFFIIIFGILLKFTSSSFPFFMFGYNLSNVIKIGSGMISLSEISLVIAIFALLSGAISIGIYSSLILSFIVINIFSYLLSILFFKPNTLKLGDKWSYKRKKIS